MDNLSRDFFWKKKKIKVKLKKKISAVKKQILSIL